MSDQTWLSTVSSNGSAGGGKDRDGGKSEDWERKMRQNMADIQKKYREKYKELYKLDVQSKKHHEASYASSSSLKRKPSHEGHLVSPKKLFGHSPITAVSTKPLPLHPELLESMGQTTNGHPHQVRQPTQQSPESFMPAPGVELVPDLSAITSKFKSSRPNPFENLLRLQKQDSQSSTSAVSIFFKFYVHKISEV